MDEAAKIGDLTEIRRLYQSGITQYDNAIDLASKYGHLEVIQFFYDHRSEIGFKYTVDMLYAKHTDVINYILKTIDLTNIDKNTIDKNYVLEDYYDVIIKCIENGPIRSNVKSAAKN